MGLKDAIITSSIVRPPPARIREATFGRFAA
jgi:hypothetical protein